MGAAGSTDQARALALPATGLERDRHGELAGRLGREGYHWRARVATANPLFSHTAWFGLPGNTAHVAYAATFNGEQDVFYVRIGP